MNRKIIVPLLLAISTFLILVVLGQQGIGASRRLENLPYSTFIQAVRDGTVVEVTIKGEEIHGRRKDGSSFQTYDPNDGEMISELLRNKVAVNADPPDQPGLLSQLFFALLPVFLVAGVWFWFMRRGMGVGGSGGLFNFGKSRARMHAEGEVKVTLQDVAGCEEAKEDVAELVEFLRDPQHFGSLGGRIPRGVLMVGPPGTGKTLLARAIAGEAKVAFFSISGSDFVEMFVGVGASRVRDLFEQAKKQSPCLVFIDEIDAVGRRRGAGLGGGHDEREQTLNQLLVEMDGFSGNEGVIVIAATNRPDVLDPALLRPGRFDRQVVVGLPDIAGRDAILKVHMRKVPLDPDVDSRTLARGTPGFSGADLANLVNEAALFAARANKRLVDMADFEKAKDKILMGTERRSLIMNDREKRLTAVHEAGHAVVGRLMPDHDPVHKVTIIPRGRALGVTLFLPERDRYSLNRRQLESQIASLFGGRVAEEMVFGPDQVTTGAQNDIERTTKLARNMVTRWGLSDRLGPLAYADEEGEVFLGRSVTRHKRVSDETEKTIDAEVRRIVDTQYQTAVRLIRDNRDKLDAMAEALLLYETIDSDQIDDIMAGRPVRAPEPPKDSGGSKAGGGRPASRPQSPEPPPVVGGPVGEH